MSDYQIENEKIITLSKINALIEHFEFVNKNFKATDIQINQLLWLYDLKIKLLNNL